ncbi:hypothetical protein GCM10018779_35280 [Streptomyces griseocarneus]|nr:hypothetical protein GCM10018779_35280 [Streptomyces griseocarneus]
MGCVPFRRFANPLAARALEVTVTPDNADRGREGSSSLYFLCSFLTRAGHIAPKIEVTGPPGARDHGGMSGPHVIRGSVSLPEAELIWRFSRSSGPGGQHVNTSDSQVELRFDLAATESLPPVWKERALERLAGRLVGGVVTVRASEHRSQWRNRETAAVRLAALLAEATAPPPKPRRPTRIPRGINERRLREKKARGETKRGRTGRDWG